MTHFNATTIWGSEQVAVNPMGSMAVSERQLGAPAIADPADDTLVLPVPRAVLVTGGVLLLATLIAATIELVLPSSARWEDPVLGAAVVMALAALCWLVRAADSRRRFVYDILVEALDMDTRDASVEVRALRLREAEDVLRSIGAYEEALQVAGVRRAISSPRPSPVRAASEPVAVRALPPPAP